MSLTGRPYETLQKVLGLNDRDTGMLAELNITYEEADFTTAINETALDNLLQRKPTLFCCSAPAAIPAPCPAYF